ncbi:MAG: primosomal protein N' [Chitinophagaceae bacterium]|nr:primosomal protein N' [Chitinophagaceae bacterium]
MYFDVFSFKRFSPISNESSLLFEEKISLYASIIIPLSLPTTFTWAIPAHLTNKVQAGLRVEVQLKNKKYAGIIKSLFTEKPENFKPKEILSVIDEEPIIHPYQIQLWSWIADYYMCNEGDVMQAAVPANLKLNSETIIIWNEDNEYDLNDGSLFTDNEYVIAEALEIKQELKLSEVHQLLNTTNVYAVIKKLLDKKVCYVWEELKEKYKSKKEIFISLAEQFKNEDELSELLNNWKRAPKQMELLLAYLHLEKKDGEVTQNELLKKANASIAQLKGLIEKNILVAEKREVDRINQIPKEVSIDFSLSQNQQIALTNIENNFLEKNVCLLHGITSSGKTLIYIKLIEHYIKNNEQVLYLLPEIALTTQIIRRLQKHFGGNIAIYHSKFNSNERVEIWNKVKTGETKVILGARSSIFLPFNNLKLIIVDEEHDSSYKQQDPAPRYNARDVAIYYASLINAKVLLGSATPSIESYYNCLQNKYALVELNERYGTGFLPSIEIVDLKKVETKERGKIPLSPQLIQALQETIEQKKQAILFQNRRGYSPYIICKTCGWIPQCNHCDVTLTFHKSKNKLNCHYCGSTYPLINTCVACGNHEFVFKNFGTEKLEELVAENLPTAKVARMDWDTVKGKNEHDNLIKLFEQGRIDVLVGTQMVVKGLDFENVNLVGIVDADGILNFTDFRVNERAFQLMEQVSGRAGRKDGVSKVLVQVTNTTHPVLHYVQTHDYKKMFQFEIETRKAYQYPPFFRIINITLKHKKNNVAEEAANIMMKGLQTHFSKFINGPAQPPVDRVRNQYLWELQIKLPKDKNWIEQCKREIQQHIAIIQNHATYKRVSIVIDVDPI